MANNKIIDKALYYLGNVLMQTKTYTYTYSLSSGANYGITGSDFGVSTPSGYYPIAFFHIQTGNGNVVPANQIPYGTGSGVVLSIRNLTSSTQTGTCTIKILYLKSSIFKQN